MSREPSGEAPENPFGKAEADVLRSETYAAAFRRMIILTTIGVVLGGVGLAAGIWGATRRPENHHFGMQDGARILPLVALNEPYLSQDQVLTFAGMCATRALTLSFSSWEGNLGSVKPCFTSEGWRGFMASIEESGTLDYIRKRRLNATAMVAGASVIEEGRDASASNAFVWRVKAPISISFESASEKNSQTIETMIEVVRTPTYENEHGVAINRFQAQAK